MIGTAPPIAVALWLGSMAFYLFLFVYFRRDRIPGPYWVVAILPFVSIFAAGRLMSIPRFLAVAWPFDWALAARRPPSVHIALFPVFAVTQGLFCWLALQGLLAP